MKDGSLEPRYTITHKDGKEVNPEHRFFVLAIDTDPYARTAALFYSYLCKNSHPKLCQSMINEYDLADASVVNKAEIALGMAAEASTHLALLGILQDSIGRDERAARRMHWIEATGKSPLVRWENLTEEQREDKRDTVRKILDAADRPNYPYS